jgi:hypothetical protein
MILWRDIGRLNRNRDMWQELTNELEKFDPACAWTRHYDRIYFEAQLLLITRSVKARRDRNSASLENMLKGFEERPEMLKPLDTGIIQLPDVHRQARPSSDIAVHIPTVVVHPFRLKLYTRSDVVVHPERS